MIFNDLCVAIVVNLSFGCRECCIYLFTYHHFWILGTFTDRHKRSLGWGSLCTCHMPSGLHCFPSVVLTFFIIGFPAFGVFFFFNSYLWSIYNSQAQAVKRVFLIFRSFLLKLPLNLKCLSDNIWVFPWTFNPGVCRCCRCWEGPFYWLLDSFCFYPMYSWHCEEPLPGQNTLQRTVGWRL